MITLNILDCHLPFRGEPEYYTTVIRCESVEHAERLAHMARAKYYSIERT